MQSFLACILFAGISSASKVNIVMILVDDLGHGGIEANNPYVVGPRVTELKQEGLYLSRHYVYKFCSPTRGSFLSGRYPYRLGNTRSNFIPWSRPDGLNTDFETLPLRLRSRGYSTHHVGKWHLGFHNATSLMPTTRGFDTFFGYLAGEQDHFNQQLGSFINCEHVVDLTSNDQPAHGANGTYSGWMYNKHAVDVVKTAKTPFFLNYWMQNTHAPFEVPSQYKARYTFKDERLRTFNGMVSVVDEAVGNVTAALKQRGLWNNTLIVYTHDNGAPLGGGGSNFPFRGGKNSNFEGGVRVPCIVGGGWTGLPGEVRNTTTDALVHISDWLPTLLSAVDGAPVQPLVDRATPTIPYDGVNQWTVLTQPGATGTRMTIVLDHCLPNFSTAGTGCNHYGVKDKLVGAIISRDVRTHPHTDWKLVLGPNGGEWSSLLNATACSPFNGRACDDGCLFNLTADPGEHVDLSQSHPETFHELMEKFSNLSTSYHPPSFNPPPEDQACCAAAEANGNFLTPWVSSPPQPALGPCVGGPGQEGWEVLNHTGGGGPGFEHYRAHDLGNASLEECRKRCCASDRCVSVVLHEIKAGDVGCWLNPRDGDVKPYARPHTLLAYVKRAPAVTR